MTVTLSVKACHNCRRLRLKCDRSVPQCTKCIKTGQECLGYQRLFRWESGIASRGKMMGLSFEDVERGKIKPKSSRWSSSSYPSPQCSRISRGHDEMSVTLCLTDPLMKDMDYTSRIYLSYFVNIVCKDLVLYDTPTHNPFRELVSMTIEHRVLLEIIVATSALRMSNANQDFASSKSSSAFAASGHKRMLDDPSTTADLSISNQSKAYSDALIAKQRALCLLQSALPMLSSANIDVMLAVVLLFIEFELIDSGQDTWQYHINGAKKIIGILGTRNPSTLTALSPLRSFLISNCLVFDIIGTTFASSAGLKSSTVFSTTTTSLLQDIEGNHCSSFPLYLLHLIQSAAELAKTDRDSAGAYFSKSAKVQQATMLLQLAQCFDPVSWATRAQQHSPTSDLLQRIHIASAHRAAVCIYLSRVVSSLDSSGEYHSELDDCVTDVITHLSYIRPQDALFKASTWPAFIAGAESSRSSSREWVRRRFQELWEVEPWGFISGAVRVLERLWSDRQEHEEDSSMLKSSFKRNWIDSLREHDVDWLII